LRPPLMSNVRAHPTAMASACTFGEMLGSWLAVLFLLAIALGAWATARTITVLQRHGTKGAHMAESLSHLILTGGDREARERESEAKRFLRTKEYESFGDPQLNKHASAARRWFGLVLLVGISLVVVGVLSQSLGSARCLLPL
jgi:hypothetical protein